MLRRRRLSADLFDLRISDLTDRLRNTDFYIPVILRLELDPDSEIAGMETEVSAWYWRSSMAYEVDDPRVECWLGMARATPAMGWVLGGSMWLDNRQSSSFG